MIDPDNPSLAIAGPTRRTTDRRTFGWRTMMYGFLRSRRHIHRRTADTEVIFLDWHHPWLFFLSVGTMLLSATDAALTLKLLGIGFFEANPIMAAIMQHGTFLFAATKMAMTGVGVLLLVYLAKARFLDRIRTGVFLTIFFLFYCCLICYEIVSLLRVM